MGHCRKILKWSPVGSISAFYSDLFSVELAENFHIHLRNLRLELDHVEFEQLAKGFSEALKNWKRRGRPHTEKYEHVHDPLVTLHRSRISPIPSLWNSYTANDEMRVELQQWADYIHLHYRNLKLEFTVSEFLDFAATIEEARRNLEREIEEEDNPKRLGKFHRANPDGRVSFKETSYWVKPPQWEQVSENPYASNYLDKTDSALKERRSREIQDPYFRLFDIGDLFDMTLYHGGELHPWMVDSRGLCRPLLDRYNFVKMVMESGGAPTMEQIQKTEYWELLGRPLGEAPWDGGDDWVYASREAQCQRFLDVTKSILELGYVGVRQEDSLKRFDGPALPKIIRGGVEQPIANNDGGYPGLITARPVGGAYCVWNGLHRIAILKYLWDKRLIADNRILVRKMDGTPFGPDDCAPPSLTIRSIVGRTTAFLSKPRRLRRLGSKILSTFPTLGLILRPYRKE